MEHSAEFLYRARRLHMLSAQHRCPLRSVKSARLLVDRAHVEYAPSALERIAQVRVSNFPSRTSALQEAMDRSAQRQSLIVRVAEEQSTELSFPNPCRLQGTHPAPIDQGRQAN